MTPAALLESLRAQAKRCHADQDNPGHNGTRCKRCARGVRTMQTTTATRGNQKA